MSVLGALEPKKVFKYFEEISAIPRGSENMEGIAKYCMDFAEKHSLKAVRDKANNVIIYKKAAPGYEKAEPIILQGHLDMVCQKEQDSEIDFMKDGIDLCIDGDFVKAKGTTLGADNGIAVAMILAILEDENLPHPAIETVFTTDEEIGMIGAIKLDFSLLSARKMINLDAEEDDSVTVSCAGGSDFKESIPVTRQTKSGSKITVTLKGLKGGHSGVEINSGRVNADILGGKFLDRLNTEFDIISINGGDKGNAIPNNCTIEVFTNCPDSFVTEAERCLADIKAEITETENDFSADITVTGTGEYLVLSEKLKNDIILILTGVPNGVLAMSGEIEGLVETSLNLGILKTEDDKITLHHTLRSNKNSSLKELEGKLRAFFAQFDCTTESFGHYPPWEFKENSRLQKLYKETYRQQFGKEVKVEAIHAGLECGVFASNIKDLDCIAIGPCLFDVHTVKERLSISSANAVFKLLLKILEKSC